MGAVMSNSNVVPLQPHPIHPLRSLQQLAAKADHLALRYDQINDLLDNLGEKIEAMTNRDQIDKLIADAKTTATLNERDQTLLAWCEAVVQRIDPDDAYEIDDNKKYILKPSVVAPRVAVLVGGFPSGSPPDPAVYLKVLMEHVCSVEALSLTELDAAIWEATGSLKFVPSTSELMVIVKRQIQQWGGRLVAIHNIAEASCWTSEEIEKLQAEAMARVQQAR
jgi:hypothetical protein